MHMMYYVAVRSPDAASAQDTPEEMELDEIPEDQDDDDDDEKDELASDAEGGVIVSAILLLRLTGYTVWSRREEAADGMAAGLTGWQKSRTMAAKTSRKQG